MLFPPYKFKQGSWHFLDIVVFALDLCWHGFQYNVRNGQSPAPFTEKVPTYNLRVVKGMVEVDPAANPPGTPVDPVEG